MTNLDGYVLTELAGQPYLLPYGQNIAAFQRGLKLNGTGKLFCQALQDGRTKEELPALLASHFEADADEMPLLREDIEQFFSRLSALGILNNPSPCLCFPTETFRRFQIGTVILQLNIENQLIPDEFLPFAQDAHSTAADTCDTSRPVSEDPITGCDNSEQPADLTVSLRFGQPARRPVGKLLIHSEELMIVEAEDCYSLVFLSSADLIACHMDKEAHFACFYCHDRASATLREELFHGIRFAYLLTAARHGLYAIHSASILYREKAWLFSAPSGTGKSTHAKLWQELYDTPALNGDLNLIGVKDGQPVVYGLPWCGTSGIFTTRAYPLGGIIFLRQSRQDHTKALTPDERSLMISQRLISPTWTRELLLSALNFCEQLEPCITCFELHCTPQPEAAGICRATIDAALAGSQSPTQ